MEKIAGEHSRRSNNSEKSPKLTGTTHNQEPDYTKPLYELPVKTGERLMRRLSFLYGEDTAKEYMPELERILKIYYAHKPEALIQRESASRAFDRFSEKDIILITYGDLLHGEERSPLSTLAKFCDTFLEGTINTLHILPFFPYSSDR